MNEQELRDLMITIITAGGVKPEKKLWMILRLLDEHRDVALMRNALDVIGAARSENDSAERKD